MFVPQAFVLALRICHSENIDVISGSDPLGGVLGVGVKCLTGLPLVVQLRGQVLNPSELLSSGYKRRLIPVAARFAARHADFVRCVSEEVRQQAIVAGIDAGKLYVEKGRCDVELFNPDKYVEARRAWRTQLGWQDKCIVGFVGMLIPLKGVEYLLRAVAILVDHRDDLRVLIAGDGPDRERLESLCSELRLSEHVYFVGHVPHQQVPQVLSACDLFVFPSASEGVPRALMEAMAMRLPLVASAVGGILELVQDGHTGLLVPPEDARHLALAIEELLNDTGKGRSYGDNARQFVASSHSWHERIRGFAALHYLAAGQTLPGAQAVCRKP
jgi:glycosyltransferase involved in cell wall biosynthesis